MDRHRDGTEFSINLKCRENLYNYWREVLNKRGIMTTGHKSRVALANRILYETAIEKLSGADIEEIVAQILEHE